MLIEWTTDLETGVDVIDEDHHATLDIYNRIYQCYEHGSDDVLLDRAISDFRFHFSLHLLREENLMAKLHYPDFETHAREHETLMNLLNRFSQGAFDNDESCQKIAFLVLQWISSHLEGSDRRLAAFIRAQGEAA